MGISGRQIPFRLIDMGMPNRIGCVCYCAYIFYQDEEEIPCISHRANLDFSGSA